MVQTKHLHAKTDRLLCMAHQTIHQAIVLQTQEVQIQEVLTLLQPAQVHQSEQTNNLVPAPLVLYLRTTLPEVLIPVVAHPAPTVPTALEAATHHPAVIQEAANDKIVKNRRKSG